MQLHRASAGLELCYLVIRKGHHNRLADSSFQASDARLPYIWQGHAPSVLELSAC